MTVEVPRTRLVTPDGTVIELVGFTEHPPVFSGPADFAPILDRRNPSKAYVSGANGGPRPKPKPVRIKRVVRSKGARNR